MNTFYATLCLVPHAHTMPERELDPEIFTRVSNGTSSASTTSSSSSCSTVEEPQMLTIPLNDTPTDNNLLNVERGEEFRAKRQTRTSFNLDDPSVFVIPNDQAEQSGVRPRVYSLYERQDLEWSEFLWNFEGNRFLALFECLRTRQTELLIAFVIRNTKCPIWVAKR